MIKTVKNMLLGFECGDCNHLHFVSDPWDGDYAFCDMQMDNTKVGLKIEDFIYMDDDICQQFEKSDNTETRKTNGIWDHKRDN